MSQTTTTPLGRGADAGTTQRIQLAVLAEPEQVWHALTDGATTPAYYYGFAADYGDLSEGGGYRYTAGGGDVITGRVLRAEPSRRLQVTFNGTWSPDVAVLPESRVTFTLAAPSMPMPGVTVLTCEHEGLPDTPAAAQLEHGWVTILSGLKTLLETGRPMVAAPA
ncbi:SRPBCC domain-containing protein [Jannaschia sp. R86511]|uniref:SRPBCC domain-containing protein n=1 Tax=Jannaschia sp. R86511 TaxID=3093853 RepID=UPI0036D2BE16